jgi:hypothetical protein
MSFNDLSKFNLYKKQIELVELLFNHQNTIIKKASNVGCDYAVALYLTLRALNPNFFVNRNSYRIIIIAPNVGGGKKILEYIDSFLRNLSIDFKSKACKLELSNLTTIEVVSSSKYALVGRVADIVYVSNLSSTQNSESIFDNAFQTLNPTGQLIISSRINKRGDLFDQLLTDNAFTQVDYKWSFNPNNDVDKLLTLIDNLQFSVLCQSIYCKYVDSSIE